MKDYRKLVVWEKTHLLGLFIYRITKAFPREEQYGLINQIRRAATSAPTNIAEGCGRYTQLDLQSIFNRRLALSKKFNTYHFCLLN